MLKAAVGSGLDLEFLCTDGNCGTCKAKLLEGEISYRREPEILYDDEKADGIVLLCIASPKTDLVVEEL